MDEAGFFLIEVIISLLLLACCLLGLDALQLTSMHATKAAYRANIAEQQINNLVTELQVIKVENIGEILSKWNQENKEVLPNGYGEVIATCPRLEVLVAWGNKNRLCAQTHIGDWGCLRRKFLC